MSALRIFVQFSQPICQHYNKSLQLIASNEARNLCQLHRNVHLHKSYRWCWFMLFAYEFSERSITFFFVVIERLGGKRWCRWCWCNWHVPSLRCARWFIGGVLSSHRRTAKLECKLCSLLTWKCVVRIFLSNCKSRAFQPQLGIFFCGHPQHGERNVFCAQVVNFFTLCVCELLEFTCEISLLPRRREWEGQT